MKSLEDRKKQRVEQRALLAHGGVIPLPGKDGEEVTGALNGGDSADQFEAMTIEQLKDWVKAQDGGAVEVPADVKLRSEVLKFARNYAQYLAEKAGQTNGQASSWNEQ